MPIRLIVLAVRFEVVSKFLVFLCCQLWARDAEWIFVRFGSAIVVARLNEQIH